MTTNLIGAQDHRLYLRRSDHRGTLRDLLSPGRGVEEEITDLFQDIYLSENSDHRPIRFRFEKLENGDLTFVDVHDGDNSDEFFSIELSGRHDLEFTVVVS